MTGNATHPVSGWIVNFSDTVLSGRCDPVKQDGRRVETGILNSQRFEDMFVTVDL